jgi:Na+-translocating ferredoxin:NAD+ oxidoreductase RnfG subunit
MRPIPALIALPCALFVSSGIHAATYLTVPAAQKAMFPAADRFVDMRLQLTDKQRSEIRTRSGERQRQSEQAVWRAERQGSPLGWFIVDEVVGKHEFITYAAALSDDGKVLGIEVLIYRESYGHEIEEISWRNQFIGKTLADPIALDEDIANISGATLSCRSISKGVKRLLALQQVALSHG